MCIKTLIFILLTFDVYISDGDRFVKGLPSSVNQYNKDERGNINPLTDQNESHQTKSVKKSLNSFSYSLYPKWPVTNVLLGQISAVDIDSKGNIVIFHRGSHIWNERSFDYYNKFLLAEEGPINMSTIFTIDAKTMQVVNRWGANLFYLPHGLSFDTKGNVWLTDVALHQVFKFPSKGSDKPSMTLGEKFVPGSDEKHFCKPTSVAIDSRNGDFYVADGYCNYRVIRFDSGGKFLNQWGQIDRGSRDPPPAAFSIPHKVVLAEDLNLVCVADREHGRIQCFTPPDGQFVFSIAHNEFNGRLFSISYSPFGGGVLYAVNGAFNPSYSSKPLVKGFLFNLTTRELLTSFGGFNQPHDIVATPDGQSVYVVEIGPNYLWRFEKDAPLNVAMVSSDKDNRLSIATKLDSSESANNESITIWSKMGKLLVPSTPSLPAPIKTFSNNTIIIFLFTTTTVAIIFIAFMLIYRRDSRNYSPLNGFKGWVNGYKSTKNELNLGRILHDPKRSGFNQLAMDDSDNEANLINAEVHSESEVEEFNVSSVRKI